MTPLLNYPTRSKPIRYCTLRWTIASVIVLVLVFAGELRSQPCNMLSTNIADYPSGSQVGLAGEIILPAVRVGVTTTFSIPINVSDYSASVDAIEGTCSDIADNQIVTTLDNLLLVTINKRCPLGLESMLTFVYSVSKVGCTLESKTFIVPVMRDSAKIVLTLDISGSMGLAVEGGTNKRIDALKDAVNAFIPKLEEFQQSGDSLGLTYFSSMVYQPGITYFDKDFVKITNNEEPVAANYASQKVFSDLSVRSPLNMTAMGLGLLDAKSKLLNYNPVGSNSKKMVFLFTDGLQNYGPQVSTDGNSLNNGIDSLNNKSARERDSVRYFTVATWEAGLAPEILNSIATKSGGEALHVVGGTPTLNDWFNVNLFNLLEDGSPQIALRKSEKSINGSVDIPFIINENICKLLIEVFSQDDDSISLTLKKGDIEILPSKITDGQSFRLFSFRFPTVYASGNQVTSGGEWIIRLTGESPKPYTLTAFVDDHLFKYRCNLNKSIYTVGDTIYFSSKLTYAGKPLDAASRVKAILLKPGDDIGTLLATYPTPTYDNGADSTTGAEHKFRALMSRDSSFYNALLPQEQVVDMESAGNGTYKGYYSQTQLAGIYNVIFLVYADLGSLGKAERTTMLSSVFKFGNIEQETPKVEDIPSTAVVTHDSATTNINNGLKGYRNISVTIKPRNRYGFYLGPGFAPIIKVDVKNPKKTANSTNVKNAQILKTSTCVKEIKDNLDGSYSIIVANVPVNTNPSINILVRDELLYSGKMWPIPLWAYILLVILIILLLLAKFFSSKNYRVYRVLFAIIAIILAATLYLQSKGFVNFF